MIICSSCGVAKSSTEYSVDNKRKSGIRARCKMCDAAAAKASRERRSKWKRDRLRMMRELSEKYKHVPPWLTGKQLDEISGYYESATFRTVRTGVPHVVDHIIPIGAKDVCGLHVPWNLQVLSVSENDIKGTSFDSGW